MNALCKKVDNCIEEGWWKGFLLLVICGFPFEQPGSTGHKQAFMFRSHRGATRKIGLPGLHFKICSRENKRSSHEAVVGDMYGKVVLTGFKHFSALTGKGSMHHERMTWFSFFFYKREHNCCMLQQLCSAAANLLLVSLHKFQMHSHLSCPSPVAFERYCKHLFVSCSLFQGK